MPTQEINLSIPADPQQYTVRIGSDILHSVGEIVNTLAPHQSAAVVADAEIADSFGRTVIDSLKKHGYANTTLCTITANEKQKSLATVEYLYQQFLSAHLERKSPVIAVGGGVTGDTAGFAAATFLRGVPFINIPTTLLSMVDASVGGKTGVNIQIPDHTLGKNLIGAFHQPRAVIIDTKTLATLPERHIRAGFAECVKHAILGDPDLFDWIEREGSSFNSWSEDDKVRFIAANVAVKANIVERDAKESHLRMILNLGHTFAHVLEPISVLNLYHGEAVALGLLASAAVGIELNKTNPAVLNRIRNTLQSLGLPVTVPNPPNDDNDFLINKMRRDKKVAASSIRLIIPNEIGNVEILETVPDSAIKAGWNALR